MLENEKMRMSHENDPEMSTSPSSFPPFLPQFFQKSNLHMAYNLLSKNSQTEKDHKSPCKSPFEPKMTPNNGSNVSSWDFVPVLRFTIIT